VIPPSRQPSAGRLWRLAEELEEIGLPKDGSEPFHEMLLEEIDFVLRPTVHEGRIVSSGTILEPAAEPDQWSTGTQLDIARAPVVHQPLGAARRFADGLSSWLVRRTDGDDEWVVFDRPAGSERDLVVLSDAFDATIVQRHPSGSVRVVGSFGVLRWVELAWHYEPPLSTWIDRVTAPPFVGDRDVLAAMLEFAIHDLGSWGIGSLLVYRPGPEPGPAVEERLPTPPPLRIRAASHLGPLRHALAQVDGAAVFDGDGVLRQLGVRLVPSAIAEDSVEALGGTRHTSGRRYSFDDPTATVVAVSADGPVSVLRNGAVLGRSPD
jgi:Probable sensor domain DACNK